MKDPLPVVEIDRGRHPPHACGYLADEVAALDYRLVLRMGSVAYAEHVRRGWRRHGVHFFRPGCPACRQCRSLRVDVARFRPSKSQRRCLRRNADVTIEIGPPSCTPEHLELYDAYHRDMHERRGWPYRPVDADSYVESFVFGEFPFAREFRYVREGRLVGVGLVDAFPEGLSSVYFYHDPGWRPLGPGTFSVLTEIETARALGVPWLYLGYWIAACPSMTYKNRFAPHEMLREYVADGAEPEWVPVAPVPTATGNDRDEPVGDE